MQKNIENRLESFVRAELAGDHRIDMTHGTMYLVLDKPSDCDFIHKEIRKFYKENINPEGGVNMYAVGEEFAFDFVPEDRETPVFNDEEYSGKEGMMPDDIDKGVWSEFAEDELLNNQEPDDSKIDTAMQLEIESLKGK